MIMSFMSAYWFTVVFLVIIVFFMWMSEATKPKNRYQRNFRVVVRIIFYCLVVATVIGIWLPVFIPGLH